MHDIRSAATRREPHHGDSLAHDLPRIARLHERRRALTWLAASGASWMLAGCGNDSSESAAATPATSAAATTATTTASTSACVADPSETAGSYPADGTNASSGATSDILTASGIVRSDIRASFLGTTTVAPGVPLTLTLTLENTNSVCSTLQGYAIYLWQCDRTGNYSLYGAPAESYLRGVQVTDSAGKVTFTTIFPGCYAGRYPHLHLEIFTSLAQATTGRNAILTTQLAMPAAICNAVYAVATGYAASATNFAQVALASDLVFGDNTAAQNGAMTPTMTGSVAAGYTATAVVGVAR
jgi:protocatechuate 3,4-dioxygenase beta subunit